MTMQSKKHLTNLAVVLAVVSAFLATVTPVWAGSGERVLHEFGSHRDGAYPEAGLTLDAAGNLYGTTSDGYFFDNGTVFQMAPGPNGTWTETVLHSFNYTYGAYPQAGLIFDGAGNLYGTTSNGGAYAYGTVYKMAPVAGGIKTVLHSFNGKDGSYPLSGLIFDSAGNLYGTTFGGDSSCQPPSGCGAVFKLAPGANGKWAETVLHIFNGKDGALPCDGLVLDTAGNLYGTTRVGGSHSLGTVFKVSPGTNGKWTETVLHNFTGGKDGANPNAGVIFDSSGNLYGAAVGGGLSGQGNIFKLVPGAHGNWTEAVLHSFNFNDGSGPYGGVIFDTTGNLYGTTGGGGAYHDGVVFKLKPSANGRWSETLLHVFNGNDGAFPQGSLIFDNQGNLYGTTYSGGDSVCDCGVVFEVTP
jgi:uncharacterized repeat protein (TIGR03803 family)